MPPEWMWPFPKELDRHFAWVDHKRRERFGNDDEDDDRTVNNDLEKDFRRGR
jgi:hypothetical protein